MNLDYKPPGPVAKAFMKDRSFVRGLRGPVGSGKSVASCM
jgi:pantothenate kinase-related protein Tda10